MPGGLTHTRRPETFFEAERDARPILLTSHPCSSKGGTFPVRIVGRPSLMQAMEAQRWPLGMTGSQPSPSLHSFCPSLTDREGKAGLHTRTTLTPRGLVSKPSAFIRVHLRLKHHREDKSFLPKSRTKVFATSNNRHKKWQTPTWWQQTHPEPYSNNP